MQRLFLTIFLGILGTLINPLCGLIGAVIGFFYGSFSGDQEDSVFSEDSSVSSPDAFDDRSVSGSEFFDDWDSMDHSSGVHSEIEMTETPFESATNFPETDFNTSLTEINPASGLPMVGDGIGGVDVAGNPYGFDDFLHSSDIGGSSIDDPFS